MTAIQSTNICRDQVKEARLDMVYRDLIEVCESLTTQIEALKNCLEPYLSPRDDSPKINAGINPPMPPGIERFNSLYLRLKDNVDSLQRINETIEI